MKDPIERQAAMERVARVNLEKFRNVCDFHDACVDCLKDLPSAQQWILCGEKLPEEHEWIGKKMFGTTLSDEVYVTFENPKGERFCKHLRFQNGKLSGFDQLAIDAIDKGSKPIAWMPLPEPYREDGDTE